MLELCLEYIGRRWRSSEAVAENVVDDISHKLTKIEFEVSVSWSSFLSVPVADF